MEPGVVEPGVVLGVVEPGVVEFGVVLGVELGVVELVSRGAVIVELSTVVESEPTVSLPELQPAAIEPIIVATNANLKICFFIGV